METLGVQKANIPTVSVNRPEDSRCPKDPEFMHCHCSASMHSCYKCGETW